MIDLTTARTTSKTLHEQHSSLSAKLRTAETDQSTLTQKIDRATANLTNIEKQHIFDKATDQELLEAQQVYDDLAAQLVAVNRRITLIQKELEDINVKISAAAQNLRIARHEFCINERNELAAQLNSHKETKSLLLQTFAAYISNGVRYRLELQVLND